MYADFDQALSAKTRFFGAASMTMAMFGDVGMFPGNAIVSQSTQRFMSGLSLDLRAINVREALAIEHGTLGGSNLDGRLVHAEQTVVQQHLDALQNSNASGYKSMISEVNRLMNPTGALGAASKVYGDDRHYQGVLDSVRKGLGHNIDFGNQKDREAVGNGLIKDLRSSGGCTVTGSRIPVC